DERVSPDISGSVDHESVRPGKDLEFFGIGKGFIRLSGPRHVQHASEPCSGVVRMNDRLSENKIRKRVGTNSAAVEVRRILLQRFQQSGVNGIVSPKNVQG